MPESANTLPARNPLTARNAILLTVGILVITLIWACAKMLRPNDSGGMADDTFGTHGSGFRALYETLEELNVPITRRIAPPTPDSDARSIVLLGPDPRLVQFEPKYLLSLIAWVEQGGRLVVAPTHLVDRSHRDDFDDIPGEPDILKLLALNDEVSLIEKHPPTDSYSRQHSRFDRSDDYVRGFREAWSYTPPPSNIVDVELSGSFPQLTPNVFKLALPGEQFGVLTPGKNKLAGTLRTKSNDDELLLAALIKRGKGEIIVLSDPALLSNRLLANADNSVLAADLLAPRGGLVSFDEYYHGLAVRGNPLYLLTRPGFAAVAAAILLVIAMLAWRAAVFLGPPLADVHRSRRDIQEYIRAMAAFFTRGPGHRRFLAREVRDGVLHEICEQLNLPPHTANVEVIASALARRSPQKADVLRRTVADIDRELADSTEFPNSTYIPSIQKLAACL
jgi:hypothetical protein